MKDFADAPSTWEWSILEKKYCRYFVRLHYFGFMYCGYCEYSQYFEVLYYGYFRTQKYFGVSLLLVIPCTSKYFGALYCGYCNYWHYFVRRYS